MADGDWKKRVGIEINYNSEDDERYPSDDGSPASTYSDEFEEDRLDHLYSKTPPRTRIIRRNRSRKEKELQIAKSTAKVIYSGKSATSYNNDSLKNDFVNSDDESSQSKDGRRTSSSSKRSMQLLRGSERDLKLDFSDIRVAPQSACVSRDDRIESMPQPAIKVETCNRFLSLTSRLVVCKNLVANCRSRYLVPTDEYLQSRVEFHDTFSKLIRMGNNDNVKRQVAYVSQEEALWQNELNDLIWLELQAWHADRTPQQQDQYLCQAREDVHNLLNEIMNYKFSKKADQLSSSSSDSGIHFPLMEEDIKAEEEDTCDAEIKICNGECCLVLSCPNCFENQNCALRDVEGMLNRLEAAEALYPSSKAFAAQYPLYLSEQFTGRVKNVFRDECK